MRDMRCANNGCCSLSKGTQSDDLVSDTSTEESTSSSSEENFKDCKTFEKVVVAKEVNEVHDESQDSTKSIHLKPPNSLHQMQTRCRSYIRWSILLSFGTLLWIALWITDIFSPNPFLKEDLATAKKVTQKVGMVKKPVPSRWWFFELWSYACDSVISVTTLEILMFLCFVMILVCLESRTRDGAGRRIRYDLIYKTLLNTEEELSTIDNTKHHLDSPEEKSALIEPEIKNCGDEPSKFSHGDVKNAITQDENKLNSQLGETRMQCLIQGESSPIENCASKSLNGSHFNINNQRKRSLQLTSSKNYCNYSRRSRNLSQDVVTSNLIVNKPNFVLNPVSPVVRSDKTRSLLGQSNLTCSVFNKSTSFMSEKIETWFELPNPDRAEEVMNSFDGELDRYFKTRPSTPPRTFEESTQVSQQFDVGKNGCESGKECKALVSSNDYNRGIVSSSPAFRRFLVNLARDRMSEPYL